MRKRYTENSQTRRQFYRFVVSGANEKIYSTTGMFVDTKGKSSFCIYNFQPMFELRVGMRWEGAHIIYTIL